MTIIPGLSAASRVCNDQVSVATADVLLLNELTRKEKQTWIDELDTQWKHKVSTDGKSAIVVLSRQWKFNKIRLPIWMEHPGGIIANHFSVSVALITRQDSLETALFLSVYRTPASCTEEAWEALFTFISEATDWATEECELNFVVTAGDFNAQHEIWGCNKTSSVGKQLHTQLQLHPQHTLINTGAYTRYPWRDDAKHSPSVIDLTLINNKSGWNGESKNMEWGIIPDTPITSDHMPIGFRIPFCVPVTGNRPRQGLTSRKRKNKTMGLYLKRYLAWNDQEKVKCFQAKLLEAFDTRRRSSNGSLWSREVEVIAKDVTEILITTANDHLSMNKSEWKAAKDRDSSTAWNAECSRLLVEKTKANRSRMRTITLLHGSTSTSGTQDRLVLEERLKMEAAKVKKSGRDLGKAIWKARMECLGQGIQGVNFRTSNSKVWELVNRLNGKTTTEGGQEEHEISRRGLVLPDDSITHDSEVIVNTLAEHFSSTNTPATDEEMIELGRRMDQRSQGTSTRTADYIRVMRSKTREHYQELCKTDLTPDSVTTSLPRHGINSKFRLEEIQASLPSRENINTSPGPDGVTKRLIVTAGKPLLQMMTDLANLMMQTERFPASWKLACVNPVAKVPRARAEFVTPQKTRPISLLSDLSKVLETALERRLRSTLEAHEDAEFKPGKRQFGFRNNHRTEDVLVYLNNNIRRAWRRGKCVVLIQLDAHKAYDKVWIPHLISQLYRALGDGALFRLLKSFLTDRTLKVKMKNQTSEIVNLAAGLAQGSSINPLMYVLDVNGEIRCMDRAHNKHRQVDGGGFADDVFMTVEMDDLRPDELWPGFYYTRDPNQRKKAASYAQAMIDDLITTAAIAGRQYDANMDKINCTVFFKPTGYKDQDRKSATLALKDLPTLYLVDKPIQMTLDNATLLGLKMDPFLTYGPHIDQSVERGKKRLDVITRLTGPRYKADIGTLRTLYQSWIAPILMYCAPAWANVSHEQMIKLVNFEAQAARVILGASFITARVTLLDELHIMPIQYRIIVQAVNYYQRAIRLPKGHLIGQAYKEWKARFGDNFDDVKDEQQWIVTSARYELDTTLLLEKMRKDKNTPWICNRPLRYGARRKLPNKAVVARGTTEVFAVLHLAATTMWLTEEYTGPAEPMSITDVRQPWSDNPTRGISPRIQPMVWPVFGPARSRTKAQKQAARKYAEKIESQLITTHATDGWIIYTDGAVRTAYAKSIIRPHDNGWADTFTGKWNEDLTDEQKRQPGRSHFANKVAGAGASIWSGPENNFRAHVNFPLGRFHYSGTSELFGPILVLEELINKLRWREDMTDQHIKQLTIVLDNQWIVTVLTTKTIKRQPLNTPILPELYQALDRLIEAENVLMKTHKDLKISYVWIPGHTDDKGKGGCVGNYHADLQAEEACDKVIRHGVAHGLGQPGLGSHHMKIPFHMMKNEIKRRMTVRWRTKRSTYKTSASDEGYLRHNVIWQGHTFNWAMEPPEVKDSEEEKKGGTKVPDERFSYESRWSSPPNALIAQQPRAKQVLITRIRLGIAPTKDVLMRHFPTTVQDTRCSFPGCTQYDSAHHRLFHCKQYEPFRLALLPRIRKILRIDDIKQGSQQWIPDDRLSKVIWTWKIMICHSYIMVPKFLQMHVKNFRIDQTICLEMATTLFMYLSNSGLDELFRFRMRECIQLQDGLKELDTLIRQSSDLAEIQELEEEKRILRIQMLGFG
jgi:hypothetical protein